jgi:predicted GNAT family acetyltransferase
VAEIQEEVRVVDDPEADRFVAYMGAQPAGFVTYRALPGRIVLIHTETDPAFQGKGIGTALAAGALDAIRARGLLVTPRCPFVRSFIGRHPEYADLVAPDPLTGG